jgi:hypothetical protein
MKTLFILAIITFFTVIGCTDARIASENLSKASDMFEIDRRIVFYNGITGEYMLVIEGRCSIEPGSMRVAVTCKTDRDKYKKHYLGISDNVTYFAEQLESAGVDTYRYRVVFKPATIVPDMDLKL